jgi:histidinol-phosphatase (PHP family)
VPWFSYHGGHSGQFCHHAKDSLEAVVQRAIEAGFTHYGLSEHCPRYRKQDLFGEEVDLDLSPDDLLTEFRGYVDEALRLRDLYAGRIELLVGFESERLPPGDWAARMAEIRESAPFDYMVGSVHDVDGVFVDFSPEQTRALADRLGGVQVLQRRYFEAVAEMVQTLKPEVVGHLDLVRKFDGDAAGFGAATMKHVERALEAVAAHGGVLDVNCGAARRGLSPVYPLPEILKRARAMGIGVTLGDDSHGTHSVGVGLDECMAAIADAGYAEVCYLTRCADGVRLRTAPLSDVQPAR